jgi:hypothetical protein
MNRYRVACASVPAVEKTTSVASQHTLHQITQWPPKVLTATRQTMLIDEEHIMLEARVQVRLQSQLDNNRVMVTINVRIHPVQALEHVPDKSRKSLGERNADATRKHILIIDVGLDPGHEVLNVFEFVRGFHFGARLRRAEFGDGAVEEVDLVVEIDHCIAGLVTNPTE